MLHVERARILAPASLIERGPEELEQLTRFFKQSAKYRGQRRPPFKREVWNAPDVYQALMELFNRKCAYCEALLLRAGWDIEHFRPKERAMELNGEVATDHYWWLSYEWSNLYLSCTICSRLKANRFPVKRGRAKPYTKADRLLGEEPLLLDPCIDEPANYLIFNNDGLVTSDIDRGIATIEILGLNRASLVERRANHLRNVGTLLKLLELKKVKNADFLSTIEEAKTVLRRTLDDSGEYLCMTWQYVTSWLQTHDNVELKVIMDQLRQSHSDIQVVSAERQRETSHEYRKEQEQQVAYSVERNDEKHRIAYYSGAKRVEHIEIKNFRLIRELTLDIPPPHEGQESWLMLIGENATGKSSVLQAIALALMGREYCNKLGLDASKFVRRGAKEKEGYVRLQLTSLDTPIELRFRRDSSQFEVEPENPKVLLLGYGATRLLPRRGHEPGDLSKYIRVQNLFDPFIPLDNAENWLLDKTKVEERHFDDIARSLKDLLMLGDEDRFLRGQDGIRAVVGGSRVTLEELSMGYQSVVALVVDIMSCVSDHWGDMQAAEGIVLVDEVEAHLHPRWKIQIVERLRKTFPRMQFIVTTHDPLCLRGLFEKEIVSMQQDENKRIIAITDIPTIEGLRADQLLTNPLLFNLDSTRGQSIEGMITRYSELFRKRNRSSEEEETLHQLSDKLADTFQEEETVTQRLIEHAIRKVLTQMSPEEIRSASFPGNNTPVAPARIDTLETVASERTLQASLEELPDATKAELKLKLSKLMM
jgi:uncharacterized protein (TIGR02646 family)